MSHPRPSRLDVVLVLALTAVSIALFPQAALVVDSGRDLAWGWSIAKGGEFPATGPSLNGLWHAGPLWYWLLGGLLWLTQSVGLTTTAVGVLAAAKIPLAWWFGRRLQGPPLGLALAAAIALPGWSTLGQMVLSHTSLVETCVMATLCLSLRACQKNSASSAVAAALALSLAVHAHPTALVAAPAVALAILRLQGNLTRATVAVACALAFLGPFAPMLRVEALSGWPQWAASTGYFGASDFGMRLLRAPSLLWGAVVHPVAFLHALMSGSPLLAIATAGMLAVAMLLATAGLIPGWRRTHVQAAFAFALWCWGFVLLLRDTTPAWMTYSCAPAGALLIALGWQNLWARWQPQAARALAGLALAAGTLLVAERMATVRAGIQRLPGTSISDVAANVRNDAVPRMWLPAWGHDAAAKRICSGNPEVAVHGDLATALNLGQGVAIEMHCGNARVSLGGQAAHHLAGIPRGLAERLELEGESTSWGYVLIDQAMPVGPVHGEWVRSHTRYLVDDFVRDSERALPAPASFQVACEANELLVATNLLPQLNAPFGLAGLAAPLATEGATIASTYYACPDGVTSASITTRVPTAVDLFLLPRE